MIGSEADRHDVLNQPKPATLNKGARAEALEAMQKQDCTLCLEWEICPFHKPDDELKRFDVSDAEVETVRIPVTQPTVIHGTQPKCGRVVSDCGHYVRTYVNGVCVDEEPID